MLSFFLRLIVTKDFSNFPHNKIEKNWREWMNKWMPEFFVHKKFEMPKFSFYCFMTTMFFQCWMFQCFEMKIWRKKNKSCSWYRKMNFFSTSAISIYMELDLEKKDTHLYAESVNCIAVQRDKLKDFYLLLNWEIWYVDNWIEIESCQQFLYILFIIIVIIVVGTKSDHHRARRFTIFLM